MHTFFNENSQFEKYLFLCVQDIPLKLKPGAGILVIKSQRGPKYRKPLEKNRSISMGFLRGSNHDMSLLFILKWTSFIFSSIKQCKQIFFKTEWRSWWGIHERQDLAYFYFLLLSFHMRMQPSVRCIFNSCKICFIYHFMFIAFFFLTKHFQASNWQIHFEGILSSSDNATAQTPSGFSVILQIIHLPVHRHWLANHSLTYIDYSGVFV